MIRQPDFINREMLTSALEQANTKKAFSII